MKPSLSLLSDLIVLLIFFCESCGRGVIRLKLTTVTPPGQQRSFNWYSTSTPQYNPYYSYPYHSLPSSYAPTYSAHQDYFNRDIQMPPYPTEMPQHNGIDSPMTILLRPLSYHNYGTGELIKVNTKGFALLGLLGLMTLLQGLLSAVAMRFTTTTTDAPDTASSAATSASVPIISISGKELRLRRSFEVVTFDPTAERQNRISLILQKILPSLNVIAHAQVGFVSLTFTLPQFCFIRDTLLHEFHSVDEYPIVVKVMEALEDFLREGSSPITNIVLERIRAIRNFDADHDPCLKSHQTTLT